MILKATFVINNVQKLSYCTQNVAKTKLYNSTIFLPKTKFPLRLENKKLIERDETISSVGEFDQLYNWQRSHLSEPEFVLHDGPPYANGKLHMGHAINKILKDTILRYEILKGNKVHYVPGWDCHGLPVELKALSASKALNADPVEIRTKARCFAQATVEEQKKVFESWGVTGDWSNHYATFKPGYYKVQFKLFHKLFKNNLIYRDVKPVYWSPSSRTALAEAELEYKENYRSPSAFVRFQIKSTPLKISNEKNNIYALVWTTTPWTLPSNQAVCYNPALKYSLVKSPDDGALYILGDDLIKPVSETLNLNLEVVQTLSGETLSNFTYVHPVYKDKELHFLPGVHVTATKGTGLVHTAPAHGPDDFVLGLENKMSINSMVNELGCYTSEAGKDLDGKFVLKEGTKAVLEIIKDDLVHLGDFVHSYPCDWRTKEPVIVRASQQWFVDTNAIKTRAIDLLEDVEIVPKLFSDIYRSNLINQIRKRPYWCISRQRKWGVPIPVFHNKVDGKPFISDDIVRHLCELVDMHGTDFWWQLPLEQLVPPDLQNEINMADVEKSQDILDIWFDSGISWANALEGNKVADMYLEGGDQLTGWFQSSLITSVALRDKAPYKTLYVHGFAVDEKGMKMSKSVGNIVDPIEIVRGSKKSKPYGVDTLRWWVACHANKDSMAHVTKNVLQSSSDEIQRIRSVIRFAIGSLEDYDWSPHDYEKLSLLDKYMLHLLYCFNEKAQEAIKEHQFHQICIAVNNLLTSSVSALYYTGIKDRLYCDNIDSISRRSSQFVLLQIFEVVIQAIAPIIPHMAEEMHHYMPRKVGKTYFTSPHPKPEVTWNNPDVAEVMGVILSIRRDINKKVGANTSDTVVKIGFSPPFWSKLIKDNGGVQNVQGELEDVLQVSEVIVNVSDEVEANGYGLEISKSRRFSCARCRRVQSVEQGELCTRCNDIVIQFNKETAVTN